MDEPTTGLDVVVQREILRQVFELKDAAGLLGPVHHPRPVAAAGGRRPGGDHVRRAGREVRAHRRSCAAAAAHPYTRGAARLVPAACTASAAQLTGIPGSPPDLRGELAGCPFVPRCAFATDACGQVDMHLRPADGGANGAATAAPVAPHRVPVRRRRSPPPQRSPPRAPRPLLRRSPAAAAAGEPAAGATRARGREPQQGVSAGPRPPRDRHLGGPGGLVRPPARVGGGPGGGERLGQEHDRQAAGRPGAAHRRRRSGWTATRSIPSARRTFRAYKSEVQMVFQDPFASLNPLHTVRYHLERALQRALRPHRPGAERGRGRQAARAGVTDPRPQVPRRLPARALGRPAPAGVDRPGAGGGSACAARRRAGLDARRLDPPGGARPDRRPAHAARPGGPLHHPRHRLGALLRRRDPGDERGPHRRARPGRGADPEPDAPLHRSCSSPHHRIPTASRRRRAARRSRWRPADRERRSPG